MVRAGPEHSKASNAVDGINGTWQGKTFLCAHSLSDDVEFWLVVDLGYV